MKNFKDSGIEWLGEIPEHWEVIKLKYLFYISKEENYENFPNVLSLTQNGIFERDITTNEGQLAQSYLGYNIVKINDIIFNPMDLLSGYVAKSNFDGVISQAYIKIRQLENLNLSYYEKLFQNWYHYKILWHLGKGVSYYSRWTLGNETLLNIKIPLPPLKEQEQIAKFLDEKCEKIANFIEKKEKLINLLKEQKQALINETITKGLDKNVNFKDSGIEWLGEIPQHWEVKKLKMLFVLGNGLNITKADFVSYGIPCVSYGEIHSKYPCRLNTTIHTLPFVSKTHLVDKPQSLLQKGDFVFADTSEDIEGSGTFTSIQSDTPIFAGYHTIILKSKGKINFLYFSFLFDSIFTRNQIRKEVCGVKVFSITKSILKEVQRLIPPLKEQEQIANFLDEKCKKIDLLIEKTEKQIKLIKEYKTILINQAVCGRIDL